MPSRADLRKQGYLRIITDYHRWYDGSFLNHGNWVWNYDRVRDAFNLDRFCDWWNHWV